MQYLYEFGEATDNEILPKPKPKSNSVVHYPVYTYISLYIYIYTYLNCVGMDELGIIIQINTVYSAKFQ